MKQQTLSTPGHPPHQTSFYDFHVALGGHMVTFADYLMPLYYKAGTRAEHLHARKAAGLFDVSHMGQILLSIEGATEDQGEGYRRILSALSRLVPSPCEALAVGQCQYTVLTNKSGGTIDDVIIEVLSPREVLVVVNAGCKKKDFDHLVRHMTEEDPRIGVTWLRNGAGKDHGLLALQGPLAEKVLMSMGGDGDHELAGIEDVKFMQGRHLLWRGHPLWVTRTGYTGEDGFEISLPAEAASPFMEALLAHPDVMPCGLGARDTLRLEAGLPLYGHELSEDISFLEAGLGWIMGSPRRSTLACLGGDTLDTTSQPKQRRLGILVEARAIPREGCPVFAAKVGGDSDLAPSMEDLVPIGHVTSGGYSPTLEAPIAQAFITTNMLPSGMPSTVWVAIRDKIHRGHVTKMPFIPTKYKR